MENPVKASPRAIMSHLLMNPVESESSISSRDEEEDSFQEMPLKLVKREIENSTDDDFDDDLEEEEDDVQQQQRIIVNHQVIYPSSLNLSRQVNEPSTIHPKILLDTGMTKSFLLTYVLSVFVFQNSLVDHHDTSIFGGDQNSVIRKGMSNGK